MTQNPKPEGGCKRPLNRDLPTGYSLRTWRMKPNLTDQRHSANQTEVISFTRQAAFDN